MIMFLGKEWQPVINNCIHSKSDRVSGENLLGGNLGSNFLGKGTKFYQNCQFLDHEKKYWAKDLKFDQS